MSNSKNFTKKKFASVASQHIKDFQKNTSLIFILVSALISIYRLIFMWRISISQFYADEANWAVVASSSSFIQNAFTPDAGYWVPLTRSVFWIVFNYSSIPEIILHLFGCLIVGFCCSSLILFRNIKIKLFKKVVVALCLGCYQSFDLLLWMNLNYYLFIVCCFLLLNQLPQNEVAKSKIRNIFIVLLFISLGKPQLSLSCCFLVLAVLMIRNFRLASIREWYFEISLIVILVTSVLFSRINSNHLELQITPENFLYAFTGVLAIPFILFLPLFAIGNAKMSEMFSNTIYDWAFNSASITFSLAFFAFLILCSKCIENRDSLKFFSLGISPLYASLFIFTNTGWASNYFWNNSCISCMSSRHIFPLYFLAIMILETHAKKRYLFFLLVQILCLNFIYLVERQIF